MSNTSKSISINEYLNLVGVPDLPPLISPFDPGYDPATLESHLEQSAHLMASLKISMACWMIANEDATRRKIAAAQKWHVPVVTGGGPFEVAVARGQLEAYLDLCMTLGVSRIECGEGFTSPDLDPVRIMALAAERGLGVQFELGKKHEGPFTEQTLEEQIKRGKMWLDAGAECLIIEARENACGVGLFDENGEFSFAFANHLANSFGLEKIAFEAPTKSSQFGLLARFGWRVHLCNVRLEELLRVEIFRRGLHADSFMLTGLRLGDVS